MPAVPKFSQDETISGDSDSVVESYRTERWNLRHAEYLCRDGRDPREELTVSLLESLGQEGSICVYSSYERSILERLAEDFPSLRKDIKGVIARLWDLHMVIRDHYYHPAFDGSYSIKAVLPAVVPSLSYGDLVIRRRRSGSLRIRSYDFTVSDWIEKAQIEEALLRYCERDTLAMVELRRELKKRAG